MKRSCAPRHGLTLSLSLGIVLPSGRLTSPSSRTSQLQCPIISYSISTITAQRLTQLAPIRFGKLPSVCEGDEAVRSPSASGHVPSLLIIWQTSQDPFASARSSRLPCKIMRRRPVSHWSLTRSPCNSRVATPSNRSLPVCKAKLWPSVNSKEAIGS